MPPTIEAFFDSSTYTYTYVVADLVEGVAAIIDPVLDYDPAAGRLSTKSADRVVDYLNSNHLRVLWILETHIHADHLSAAAYLKNKFPSAETGIGERVREVQAIFGDRFNAGTPFARDGSQFDRLFADSEKLQLGSIEFVVLATPGHTPACVTYVFDDCAFVGDSLFMPDYGTARADFPGGDARTLFRSIRKILSLPSDTRLFMCHDYGTSERSEYEYQTSVGEERENNILVNQGVSEDEFVAARECRDAKLKTPQLLYPSVQFNMRGGQLPPAESNGQHYLKIPVRAI